MPLQILDVTPTMEASALDASDLAADSVEVENVMRVQGGKALLKSLVLIDQDDQGAAVDVWFTESTVDWGDLDSAPGIVDADALKVLGVVPIATTDYKDVGGSKIACIKNIDLVLKAASGSKSIFLAIINGAGTPDYTATGVTIRLGVEQM